MRDSLGRNMMQMMKMMRNKTREAGKERASRGRWISMNITSQEDPSSSSLYTRLPSKTSCQRNLQENREGMMEFSGFFHTLSILHALGFPDLCLTGRKEGNNNR